MYIIMYDNYVLIFRIITKILLNKNPASDIITLYKIYKVIQNNNAYR